MRYALGIEYDGRGFFGWQMQRQTPTVQQSVQEALARVADHELSVVCSGRTDTGVHALCQVAHFDSAADRSARAWILGANSNLPDTISVLWVQAVDASFHARFSAFARSYRYRILNRWNRPALETRRACWCRKPLDADLMHAAAQVLLGEHDFSAFRSSGCKANHSIREVLSIEVTRDGDLVYLDVTANGFLYHMVRNIVGSLLDIGSGERPVEWMSELLAGKDRRLAGVTAVPDGLYFVGARYPESFGVPALPTAFPETGSP